MQTQRSEDLLGFFTKLQVDLIEILYQQFPLIATENLKSTYYLRCSRKNFVYL